MELRNGVDIIEIDRIAHSMANPRFLAQYFSPEEQAVFADRDNAPQHVAANFAAKEAVAKALGCGLRGFELAEISVLRDSLGAPYLVFTGAAAALVEQGGWQMAVSLSHDRGRAIAMVTAWRA